MVRHSIKEEVFAAVAAIQFLTRLPVPVDVPFERRTLARSVTYFPLAGLLIGGLTACAAWLLSFILPPWPSAILTLAIWIGLSGGLHLDGWMDTADGVLSHRSRERMLEIMKDSRVGAMGVTAAVLLLLLKASLLAELIENGVIWLAGTLIAAACLGRSAMGFAIACWPFARKDEGIGSMFNEVNKIRASSSLVFSTIIIFSTFMFNDIKYIKSLSIAIVSLLLMALIVVVMGNWLNRKLGGLTGDTYGAINEAVEVLLLMAAVVVIGLGT